MGAQYSADVCRCDKQYARDLIRLPIHLARAIRDVCTSNATRNLVDTIRLETRLHEECTEDCVRNIS